MRTNRLQKVWPGFALLLAIAGAPATTEGAIVIDLPDIVVFVPDNSTPYSGFLEVTVTLTGADLMSPPQVETYNVAFNTVGTGITFTGAISTTDATPLFPSPLGFSVVTSLSVAAADDINSPIPLFDGAGLVRVPFTIAAGNAGTTYPLIGTPLVNQFSTNNGATVYIPTVNPGSILVAIPEAPAWMFAALALGSLIPAGIVLRRRRARTS